MNMQIETSCNQNKLAEVIDRPDTGFDDRFLPQKSGAIIPADKDLFAAGYRSGSYRPRGWTQKHVDVFSKQVGSHVLWVRGTIGGPAKFWTTERVGAANDDDQILTHAMCDLPILNRTYPAAMRLAEFCQSHAPIEQWFFIWEDINLTP